jgi:hypothetical protein
VSRSERYNARDLTYSAEHRLALPALYRRIGHRADACDRDWTEFCHYCWQPLGIFEEVRDRGQDLLDKGVGVTVQLAKRAILPAGLIAWRTHRPAEVQARMDQIQKELRALEAQYPITGFTVRELYPQRGRLEPISPEEHWRRVAQLHAEHEIRCPRVPLLERRWLDGMRSRSLVQPELWSPLELTG